MGGLATLKSDRVDWPAPMNARIEYDTVAPDSTKGLAELERFFRSGSLPPTLIELVMLRSSQLNGCAYCLDLHSRRARRAGVPQAQIDTLGAWSESPAFSERERAALSWTDSLTQIAVNHVPDSDWELVRAHFTPREIVELSIAVIEINAWNRLMIAFRTPPTFGMQHRPPAPVTTTSTPGPDSTPTEPPAPPV
jgi:AhpD family alkylhydroperoxidase